MGLAVWFLRALHGWTQKELAQASGVSQAMISLYETGHESPSRKTLARLAGGAGFPLPFLERLLPLFRAALSSAGSLPANAPEDDLADLAAALGREMSESLRVAMADLPLALDSVASPATASEREAAPARWARLERFAPEDQRFLVENAAEYRSFALCELLGERSVEAAPNGADRALALAGLALFIAERAAGSEAWRSRLQGYAWAFVGNARRVAEDHAGAEDAFRRSRALWKAGEADPGDLDASRVLDLEASFLRERRRFRLPPADLGWVAALARSTHWVLYGMLLSTVLLGATNALVRGANILGLFTIPSIAPDDNALQKSIQDWHGLSANVLLAVAAFHALAGLFHYFIRRDNVLGRMIPSTLK